MRKLRWFSVLAALALAACGGGSNTCDSSFSSCGSTGGTPKVDATSIVLVSDTATIDSANTTPANLTAYVLDANHNFVSGALVQFKPDSGGIAVTQATTDASGVATATLNTLGDPTNRAITVTATVTTTTGDITATATVNVVGSKLSLQGAQALTVGQQATYTVSLVDSKNVPIVGATITVTPPGSLTVGTTTLTTDGNGQATFTGTGAAGTAGKLKADGGGATSQIPIAVNSDAVTFSAPAAESTIHLNTQQVVTVNWSNNGTPMANSAINMATTRGCIVTGATTTCAGQPTTAIVMTDASGNASITVVSENAGGATISGTVNGGTSGTLAVQFIATVAASIDVQPDVFTLAPGGGVSGTSKITAVVRDANNNLVTGSTVAFTLNDITGGTLTLPTAITDQEGRAQTTYNSGSTASAANGVQITATVQGTAVSKTVFLTVARQQVFISIGTGNEITEPNQAQYQVQYIVQVTDSTGAGVKAVPLSMSVLSQRYFKGARIVGTSGWATCYTIPQDEAHCIVGTTPVPDAAISLGCADEDFNRNGILDPGENQNGINPATGTATLEAGNIALVTPANPVTDDNGFVLVNVYYPQEYAYYLQVTLQAQATVQGTAFSAQSTFLLAGSANDFNTTNTAPPGITSPFGRSNTCSDMN